MSLIDASGQIIGPPGKKHESVDVGQPDDLQVPQAKPHPLSELLATHHFFTVGVIQREPIIDRDVVVEYIRAHRVDREAQPKMLQFSQPLFTGLGMYDTPGGVVSLDRLVYAIPQPEWLRCCKTIGGMVFTDRRKKYYGFVHHRNMSLTTPQGVVIPVTAFGLSTNYYFAYLDELGYHQLPASVPVVRYAHLLFDTKGVA